MSAHTAKQIRRRKRGPVDDAGSTREWEARLNEWQERRGIEKRMMGLRRKPVDPAP